MYIAIANSIGASSRVNGGGGGGSFTNKYSLNFDGVDDNLYIGTALNSGTDSTISLWIKRGRASGTEVVLSENSYTSNYIFEIGPGAQLWYRIDSVYLTFQSVAISAIINNNTTNWTNICFVRSGDSVELFLNGNSMQVLTGVGSVIDTRFDRIGSWYNYTYAFQGNIDEVSAFNSALTSSDITDIYNSGVPTDLTSLSPVAWYRNGDNGTWARPQWLIPSNENKDKVSNYSLAFDGVDDYVNTGFSALDGATSFTLSCWINTSYNSWQYLFGDGSFTIFLKQNINRVDITFNGAVVGRSYNFAVTLGQWHHVAITFDASLIQIDRLKVYIDDFRVTNSLSGTTATSYVAVSNFMIGRAGTSSSTEWNGYIDEFATFNSVQNISDLYNSGTPTTLPSGAVAHWKMGENSTFVGGVWAVEDVVGSNDGTSSGMLIDARVGDAPNSTSNAVSLNMDEVDRETDVPA